MATEATEVIDADVVDDHHEPASTAVAVRPEATLTVAPQVEAAELGARMDVIKTVMKDQMIAGVDYGVIPGTNKPTLLKPGSEKLGVLFQFDVQIKTIKEWGPGDHLTVESHATVYHAPTGIRVAGGEGLCTTREKKYGKRTGKRACPQCGAEQINKSKFPPRDNPSADPGWYCHSKFGGCGAQFDATDQRITSQETGEVENPDIPDTWNTVIKMANKRARIDAMLAATGASALFTQDVEDQQVPDNEPPAAAPIDDKHPYGPTIDSDEVRQATADACVRLCGGDRGAGQRLWMSIREQLHDYMPVAASVAIRTIAAVAGSLTKDVPFDPEYVDDRGEQPSPGLDAEVAGLEDTALELAHQLWSAQTAKKKVEDAAGNIVALRALVAACQEGLAAKAA